ncbi:response regulator [Planctomycetaceae bacterium SH139]
MNATKTSLSCRRILHVDDDHSMLRLVRSVLENAGYEVISVDDPQQVIKVLQEQQIQLVISDVDMPHLPGIELLRQIKSYRGNIQVIMLTGLVTQMTAVDSMSAGAEYCLFKPLLDPTPLLMAVENTFAKLDFWRDTLFELKERKMREQGQLKTTASGKQPRTAKTVKQKLTRVAS